MMEEGSERRKMSERSEVMEGEKDGAEESS